MGKDSAIIDDLRDQVASLKALAERLMAQNAKLTATVKAQAARIADLKDKLAAANKNSSNSSMPPSSDLFKPTPPKRRRKKKSGAKRGHPRHTRAPFPPEEVDEVVVVDPGPCSRCGHAMERLDRYGFCQQVELVEKPCRVTEFRAHEFYCEHCGKEHRPQFPPGVRRLLGERLAAATAALKADGHMSYSAIRRFLADVLGLPASRGLLAKEVARTSETLSPAHAELRERLKGEAVLNVDETSHKDAGDAIGHGPSAPTGSSCSRSPTAAGRPSSTRRSATTSRGPSARTTTARTGVSTSGTRRRPSSAGRT